MLEVEKNVEAQVEAQEVDKHAKFQEQSANLVRKAMAAIENVGKVSNQRNFEYSDEEVEKMFAVLEETLADTKHMFKKKKDFNW
jgi:hypothetical protein